MSTLHGTLMYIGDEDRSIIHAFVQGIFVGLVLIALTYYTDLSDQVYLTPHDRDAILRFIEEQGFTLDKEEGNIWHFKPKNGIALPWRKVQLKHSPYYHLLKMPKKQMGNLPPSLRLKHVD